MIQALKAREPQVRKAGAYVLAGIGSQKTLPDLINALNDDDPGVRKAAALALGKIGTEPAVPGLAKLLKDKDNRVRRVAVFALNEIDTAMAKSALVQAVRDIDPFVRKASVEALGTIDDPEQASVLAKALGDGDAGVRKAAASALGAMGAADASPALVEALDDEDPAVRRAAVEALDRVASADGGRGLTQALNAKDAQVREKGAEALGKVESPNVIHALIHALKDPDARVRRAAASVLAEAGSIEAVPTLMRALEDGDSTVRREAALALGNMGHVKALPALIETMRDHPRRKITKEASGKRHRAIFVIHYGGDPDAVRALSKMGNPAVPHLIQVLRDENSRGRVTAAEALGEIGSMDGVQALIEVLKEEDSPLRVSAATALKRAFPKLSMSQLQDIAQIHHVSTLEEFLSQPYSANMLAYIHLFSSRSTYSEDMRVLGGICTRNTKNDNVEPDVLLKDIERVKGTLATQGSSLDRNPYVLFFVAYILKERGAYDQALALTGKAEDLLRSRHGETALRICIGWVRVECLWKLGKSLEGMEELRRIEDTYLPKVTSFERSHSELPFVSFTRTLKGILLSSLGETKESLLTLYRAEESIKSEESLSKESRERIKKIILAYRAMAQAEGRKEDTAEAVRLAEATPARMLMERDAEALALATLE
jgi:HEAT repeat protein